MGRIERACALGGKYVAIDGHGLLNEAQLALFRELGHDVGAHCAIEFLDEGSLVGRRNDRETLQHDGIQHIAVL
jgi:hypothetical protein